MKQREPLGVDIIFMILLTTKVCVFRHERCVFYSRLQKKKMKRVLMEGSTPEVPVPGAIYYPAALV